MELKRMVARDSNTALKNVRHECGDNALIVSTNKIGQKTEIVYAVENSMSQDSEKAQNATQPAIQDQAFEKIIKSEMSSDQTTSTPDMKLLLSEIRREIGSLRAKLEKTESVHTDKISGDSAVALAKKSTAARLDQLLKKPFCDQNNWGNAIIIVNSGTRRGLEIVESLLHSFAPPNSAASKSPVLISVYEDISKAAQVSSRLTTLAPMISRSDIQCILTHGRVGASQLVAQMNTNSPIVIHLDETNQKEPSMFTDLASGLRARLMFCADCTQDAEKLGRDLSSIPKIFRKLILFARREEELSDKTIHELASADIDISGILSPVSNDRTTIPTQPF